MLFVQCITLRYRKDVRYANYANMKNSIKFWKLSNMNPQENEIIFSDVYLYQTTKEMKCLNNSLQSLENEAFNNTLFSQRLAVEK